MDCALRLRERHGVTPGDVAEIRCRTAAGPVPRLWEPLAAKHAPAQRLRREVQPAVPRSPSILVNGRAGLADFTDEAVRGRGRAGASPAGSPTTSTRPSTTRASSSATWRSARRRPRARGAAGPPARRSRLPDEPARSSSAKFRGNARAGAPRPRRSTRVVERARALPGAASLGRSSRPSPPRDARRQLAPRGDTMTARSFARTRPHVARTPLIGLAAAVLVAVPVCSPRARPRPGRRGSRRRGRKARSSGTPRSP